MTDLQTYTNAAFGSVRILYEDGKPLFCGADACKALGYMDPKVITPSQPIFPT